MNIKLFSNLIFIIFHIGMYFCSIDPVNRIPLSETSTLEGQISVSVHLYSMDHSSSLSQQQVLTFLSAFHVKQPEVILTDVQPSALLVISASSAVQRCIVVCILKKYVLFSPKINKCT